MALPVLVNWVKKGEFILQTGELKFPWTQSEFYLQESLKNEGKYDVTAEGILVEKANGKPPKYVSGSPFPKIDPKDPKAGTLIMQNHSYQ